MLSKRAFLQMSMAAAACVGASGVGTWARVAAQDRFDQDALLNFESLGNVTLMHVSDIRAQMVPAFYREPDTNIGLGDAARDVPHLTGERFRIRYGIGGGSPMDYALTHQDFVTLARAYGKTGGLDRVATVIAAIRAERPKALLLDGGDSMVGSYTSLKTQGLAMARVMAALKPDAMTVGREFGLGAVQLAQLLRQVGRGVLAQNMNVGEASELSQLVKPFSIYERGGIRIAVIGQAYPFTQDLITGQKSTEITFGLRAARMQAIVKDARAQGADLVVCLSQSGFHSDQKMARDINGIDVILSGHSHFALPEPVVVGKTHIIASGGQGRFVSRIDLDVQKGALREVRHKLIPIFSDLITPDPKVRALIRSERAPFADDLARVLGTSDEMLHTRGTLTSSWDRLVCDAMMAEHDAEIAVFAGQNWGRTVLPGHAITREAIYSVTAQTTPHITRTEMTGAAVKDLLEKGAEGVFAVDPYQRTTTQMLRAGGIAFKLDPTGSKGSRIVGLVLQRSGAAIDPLRTYVVARLGHADRQAAPICEVVEDHVRKQGRVAAPPAAVGLVTL